MRVALIGASGLTGRQLAALIGEKHDLLILGRRAGGFNAREVVAQAVEWPAHLERERLDVAISTLGTTWKKAGGWPAFEAIDHDAVLGFARAARAAGARQFIAMSSVGAAPGSRNRYLALKGRVEHALVEIGFERLDIIQPGLLRGARGTDRRVGEQLGILVSPLANLLLRGQLDRFAAIDASTVAVAIAALVGAEGRGTFVHCNRQIHALAAMQGDATRLTR